MAEAEEPLFDEYFTAPARLLVAMMDRGGVDAKGIALVKDLYDRYAKPDNWMGAHTSWDGDGRVILALDISEPSLKKAIHFAQTGMSRPRARELLRLMERMAGRNGRIEGPEAEFYNWARDAVQDKIPYFDPEADKRRKSKYEHLATGVATERQMIGARPPNVEPHIWDNQAEGMRSPTARRKSEAPTALDQAADYMEAQARRSWGRMLRGVLRGLFRI